MKLLDKLPDDKIKIRWNKNPVRMDLFLSFLTVDVEKSKSHPGIDTGWTRYNGENGLEIGGGYVYIGGEKVELLDSIKYGVKIQNQHSNFVTPLHARDILSNDGVDFFIKYYSEEIERLKNESLNRIDELKRKQKDEADLLNCFMKEIGQMKGIGA